ncbi:bifunctional serine/threonine-protein kinase/formylglycine-generating enzyme family protein [Parendozoicomonas haliclonae]|uniref:Serine/threonine-protein kinase PknB n=1 Tax=Parendozoicomonas haliclonae TaxID=1960125 RepID=A0A1X7ARE2_9GAMM|nr:bifunctional serine/threonine-protein kinase/formylglycine-generating enzyme family protein [Parendozoicomonas haliclonae]SMA50669.1 Serine/threonine-protein kinase PknB [Parendozoicomonas haliclonae]
MSTSGNDKTIVVPQAGNSETPEDKTVIADTISANTGGSTFIDSDKTVLSPSISNTPVSATSPNTPEPPQPQPKPTSGSSLKRLINNRFELKAILGSGGMGAVYKAVDLRKVEAKDRDPYVAIKLLNEDFKKHPDAFVSLQRESRKSQSLAHPNIVTVYDFDRDGETVFMTMEFMEGDALDTLIRKSAGAGLEFETACHVFRDISEALAYAHSKNTIHSDFKPGNIFVLNNGKAKVFDFGIARAVSSTGAGMPADGDKTVFDAGSLSALTPAYASYEMLKGQEPSTSDDVYALACVAYEMFTGSHPYNKTPADKAAEQKLKPKRIKQLSSRQWRALEKALAFKSADRTQTVKELEDGFFGKSRIPLYAAAAVLVATTASSLFFLQDNQVDEEALRVELEEELQTDIRANVELELNQKAARETLQQALDKPLSEQWDAELTTAIDAYQALAPEDKDSIIMARQTAMSRYLDASSEQRQAGNLDQARQLLDNASYWQQDSAQLAEAESLLADAHQELLAKQEQQRLAAEAEAERLAEARRQQQQEQARREKLRREKAAREQREQAIAKAVDDVEAARYCSSNLSISTLSSALTALKQLSESQYQQQLTPTTSSVSQCIKQVARRSPATASKLKNAATAAFPGANELASIKIDFCAHLPAGSGSKGRRYFCEDKLLGGQQSPTLVVAKAGTQKLAVTRYEITIGDYNLYCKTSGQCSPLAGQTSLPASNISIDQAKSYSGWLSQQTGYSYRLPTYDEWLALASPERNGSDPDRNCFLKFGGLQKGKTLVSAKAGKANDNGLVNTVGNVQEWTTSGNNLIAAGGSRKDPLKRCLVTTKTTHSGQADEVTGFRLVRAIR